MSILDSIKEFGSQVISGIGGAFVSGLGGSTTPAPINSTSTQGSLTSSWGAGIGTLYDSAVSRISNWINPPAEAVSNPPAPVYVFGGSSPISSTTTSTAPSQAGSSLFGLPHGIGLMLVAAGVGYFLLTRRGR
jgi:hypothetical protein